MWDRPQGTGPLYLEVVLRMFCSPACSCVSLSSLRMSYGDLLCAGACLPTRVCAHREQGRASCRHVNSLCRARRAEMGKH